MRAYLDVMQMRIPDRLAFELRLDPAATNLECPPMTLLTLVENAVKHGVSVANVATRRRRAWVARGAHIVCPRAVPAIVSSRSCSEASASAVAKTTSCSVVIWT